METTPEMHLGIVWFLGFLGGYSRTVRDNGWFPIGNSLSVGMVSGFFAFAVVALTFGDPSRRDYDRVITMGVASIVGLGGKEIESLIIRSSARKIMAGLAGILAMAGQGGALANPADRDEDQLDRDQAPPAAADRGPPGIGDQGDLDRNHG